MDGGSSSMITFQRTANTPKPTADTRERINQNSKPLNNPQTCLNGSLK